LGAVGIVLFPDDQFGDFQLDVRSQELQAGTDAGTKSVDRTIGELAGPRSDADAVLSDDATGNRTGTECPADVAHDAGSGAIEGEPTSPINDGFSIKLRSAFDRIGTQVDARLHADGARASLSRKGIGEARTNVGVRSAVASCK
jgi:hypothetical protein